MKNLGIYIHIPFCRTKCRYCDFCSHPPTSGEVEAYISALKIHIGEYRHRFCGYVADTVYFGGGTPTLLSAYQLGDILETLAHTIDIAPHAEITTECNPATVDYEALCGLRRSGINRLSIGAQSMNDDELRALGRLHTAEDFKATFESARRAGFDNISLDLMYGIPRQTPESWLATLDAALALSPQHISAYGLRVEQGTPFGDMGDRLILPHEVEVVEMYLAAIERFGAAGIYQYEISNFAAPGRESRHNMKYWKTEPYVGFGAAAHSFFDGVRYAAPADVQDYIAGARVEEQSRQTLTEADMETEYVMLALRLQDGLDKRDYEDRFGVSPTVKYADALAKYIKSGHVIEDAAGYRLSREGMLVSNYILSDILDL